MKILTFDLENGPHVTHTWGLYNQNIGLTQLIEPGRVLCWAGKWLDSPKVEFASIFHHGRQEMLDRAWRMFDQADIIVGWNSLKHDVPKIQTEWFLEGMLPPSPWQDMDMLPPYRKLFSFPSNKLEYIGNTLSLGGKVRHPGHPMWIGAMAGDPKSWARMKRYNIGDVRLTEGVYLRTLPWLRNHPHVGLLEGDPLVDKCSRCGSLDLQKRGFHMTRISKFQRYQCQKCGAWSTGSRAVARVNVRGIL